MAAPRPTVFPARSAGRRARPTAGLLAAAGALTLLAGCGAPPDGYAGGEPTRTVGPTADATPAPPVESTTAVPKPTAPPAPTTTTGPAGRYVFPVGGDRVSYHRTHSGYKATDIFADCGRPVRAVTDGTVLEVSRTDTYRKSGPQGPANGGLSVSLLGTDGVRYYGSHLSRIAPGIGAGVKVRAGREFGAVGRTGNANGVCHLHFGISPPCARTGDWWVRRGVIWPYPYLDSWRSGGEKSPAAEVTAFLRAASCPAEP